MESSLHPFGFSFSVCPIGVSPFPSLGVTKFKWLMSIKVFWTGKWMLARREDPGLKSQHVGGCGRKMARWANLGYKHKLFKKKKKQWGRA